MLSLASLVAGGATKSFDMIYVDGSHEVRFVLLEKESLVRCSDGIFDTVFCDICVTILLTRYFRLRTIQSRSVDLRLGMRSCRDNLHPTIGGEYYDYFVCFQGG